METYPCDLLDSRVPLLSILWLSVQSWSGAGPMSASTLPQVQGGEGGGGRTVSGDNMATLWPGEVVTLPNDTGVTGLEWWGVGVLLLITFSVTMSAQPTVLSRSGLSPLSPDLVVLADPDTGGCRDTAFFSTNNCLALLVLTTSRALWLSSKLADLGSDLYLIFDIQPNRNIVLYACSQGLCFCCLFPRKTLNLCRFSKLVNFWQTIAVWGGQWAEYQIFPVRMWVCCSDTISCYWTIDFQRGWQCCISLAQNERNFIMMLISNLDQPVVEILILSFCSLTKWNKLGLF